MSVDAPNLAALRYAALLPSLPQAGPPVPFYTRKAVARPARVDHLTPGAYTVCAVPLPGDPRDPLIVQRLQQQMIGLPMKCAPAAVGGGEKRLTLTVPAAWIEPSE